MMSEPAAQPDLGRTPALARPESAGRVHAFVRRLLDRHQARRRGRSAGAEDHRLFDPLSSLELAEAALRFLSAESEPASRPSQLAVIGPTQVGKSTIVNLLVGMDAVEVSPLAGFTVHPHGLQIGQQPEQPAWADTVLPGWWRVPPEELRRDRLDAWTLCPADPPFSLSTDAPSAGLPRSVVWDTPDFDSLAAATYERGVLEVLALADAWLLVLSREKYADLSVWTLLRLLQPLGRPLVICLNKVTPESEQPVVHSLRERLSELGDWAEAPITIVPQQAELADPGTEQRGRPCAAPLIAAASAVLSRAPARSGHGARRLIAASWERWTAPIRGEHAAVQQWAARVDAALRDFAERYRRDYLDHPHRYDSFRRAAVELLHFLEVPRLSSWMAAARQTVTWPVRQLWEAGRTWRQQARGARRDVGTEEAVLFDALDGLLTSLQRTLTRRADPADPGYAVWQTIAQRLESREHKLRDEFQTALHAHHVEVSKEIHAAANELFDELKKNPARLTALRAGRATLDAGALLLAVKSGGLSMIDAVWAPATFALTSLLTEGMAGAQMAHVAGRLKRRQMEFVQERLIDAVLAPRLRGLAADPDDPALFGVSAEDLADAEQQLRAWQEEAPDG